MKDDRLSACVFPRGMSCARRHGIRRVDIVFSCSRRCARVSDRLPLPYCKPPPNQANKHPHVPNVLKKIQCEHPDANCEDPEAERVSKTTLYPAIQEEAKHQERHSPDAKNESENSTFDKKKT